MKTFFLFLSFLTTLIVIGAVPALGNESSLTDRQRQTLLIIVNQLLLSDNTSSADGLQASAQNNPSSPGSESGTDNTIKIVISGSDSNEILVKTADGLIFNLTKINQAGLELAADAEQWACLRDNNTGLIWETKTSSNGLHHQNDSFSWQDINTKSSNNTVFAENGGATCAGYVAGDPSTYCNTQAYVQRVNNDGWCGYQDWRMPSIDELKGIVALNQASSNLYARLFPMGTEKAVWSASPVKNYSGFSWHIYLNDGYAHGNDQSGNLPVLLVRNAKP